VTETDGRSSMVLLVDDQPVVAEAIRRMIASEPDIDFHYCRHAGEAVAVAQRIKPTVILQDLVMPNLDGLALLRLYRADPETMDIPVVVLSTREEPLVKSEAFKLGASDYLVKLPDPIELIARIRLHSRARLNQLQRDEAYRALRASQQQLVVTNTELASLNQRLENATRAKSDFLAHMSHEIRTPMNGVLGITTLLLDTRLTSEQMKLVETIRTSGNDLLTIINDILDLSKVEAGRIELEMRPFDLRQALEGVVSLLAPRAHEKHLGFSLHVDPALPSLVIGDVTRVRQVLINLVGNAIKFTRDGGVTVSAAMDPAVDDSLVRIHIAVADTGIGIPFEAVSRLFEPFSQADASTTREFGGTGLGLVISRRLAEHMGGGIDVDSEVGRGSTFHVRLVLQRAVAGTVSTAALAIAAHEAAATAPRRAPSAERPPLRLLLADDNVINQKVGVGLLKRLGYTADVVSNGVEVLRALDESDYDVILLDIQMPEMDGYETARRVRAKWATNEAERPRMIAMTANALESDRDLCLEAGMDDYLSKPMQADALQAALERSAPRTAVREPREHARP
jgi:two-component system, sensor histidine kinase